jgi:peptidoglycan hydrolase-like protein with peptidoglycan-binding domain
MKLESGASIFRAAARRGAILAVVALVATIGIFPGSAAHAQNTLTIPAGTVLDLRIETGVRTNQARPGDEFRATVASPVFVNGVNVIPAGSVVVGRVLAVTNDRSVGRPSGVTLQVDRITSPSGVSVDVLGDLADSRGTPFIAVDNLPVGAAARFRINRAVRVTSDFFAEQQPEQQRDFLNTAEVITQAQIALRELGYYTGRVDGRLTPATRAAITAFQREERLTASGFLDRVTVRRLGLVNEGGAALTPVNVISASAATQRNNNLEVRIATQGANNLQLVEDHMRRGDVMHIFVRGFRSYGYTGGTGELTVTLNPNEWQGVNRIVVHSAGENVVIRSNQIGSGSVLTVREAEVLERNVTSLLEQYARALNVGYNRVSGQLQFSSWNYRENEVELLFALNSLASTSRLYTQLLRTSTDPQAVLGATDVYVQQVNVVQNAFNRTKSGRAISIRTGWDNLRGDFERLATLSNRSLQS